LFFRTAIGGNHNRNTHILIVAGGNETGRNNEREALLMRCRLLQVKPQHRNEKGEKWHEIVANVISKFEPDLVFIDGIRDLLLDFNNITESTELVNLLMRLSSVYNCHVCTVLHENKGNNDLRRHAGTELQNKCETVISVEKDGDLSAVSQKYCRNIPFEKFYFRINAEGLPEYCEPEIKPKNTDKLKELFTEILPENTTASYAELQDRVMKRNNVKTAMAQRKIKQATEQSIIFKNSVGKYYLVPNECEEQLQTELPY
jgi:hypothetical protein